MVPRLGHDPGPDNEAMQQRLRELEEELKKKSDQQQTVNLVKLEQLKERLRQLEDSSRADQQRVFDTYRKYGPASDPVQRNALNKEVGSIQIQLARRGQEQTALREQIAKLEAETGLGPRTPGASK